MRIYTPLIVEEKEVLLQKYFIKGLNNFDRFTRNDLDRIYKLSQEVIDYGK